MNDLRHDDGFTLIESVIVIVLIGLISLAIGFAITTVLRVTPTAESQVSDARSIQGLTAWFAADAASANPSSGVDRYPSSSACILPPALDSTTLVGFRWTVPDPAPTTYAAVYRLEGDGAVHVVRRYACSGSGTGPYSGASMQQVTGPVTADHEVLIDDPDHISMELSALDGTPLKVSATPRNSSAALPPPAVPATVAPASCEIVPETIGPNPVARENGDLLAVIAEEVDLTLSVIGDGCGTITIRYTTGDPNAGVDGTVEQEVTVTGTSGWVTIPTWIALWRVGSYDIDFYSDCMLATCTATEMATTALKVT